MKLRIYASRLGQGGESACFRIGRLVGEMRGSAVNVFFRIFDHPEARADSRGDLFRVSDRAKAILREVDAGVFGAVPGTENNLQRIDQDAARLSREVETARRIDVEPGIKMLLSRIDGLAQSIEAEGCRS